jgi:molybdenum cofactor cytidylyltransferase
MGEIWAIILAAGESRRMGSPKMLLPFNGRTMIENVIENVKDSDVERVLIVLGPERERLTSIARKMNVRYCYNDNFTEGMLSSVQCGFSNLPDDYRAVLVFQGDQPLITKNPINRVIEKYSDSDNGIVVPVYRKRRGHPILIDRKYHNEIANLNPSKGLRSLAELFSDDVVEAETDDPGILRDFDTYEQYIMAVNII